MWDGHFRGLEGRTWATSCAHWQGLQKSQPLASFGPPPKTGDSEIHDDMGRWPICKGANGITFSLSIGVYTILPPKALALEIQLFGHLQKRRRPSLSFFWRAQTSYTINQNFSGKDSVV